MSAESTIPWAKPTFWGDELALVSDALASTWISGGPFVERLEREFLALTGSRHALTTSNGTTAIHMAYLALGVKPGARVVMLNAPAVVFLPNRVPCGPRKISIRSTSKKSRAVAAGRA